MRKKNSNRAYFFSMIAIAVIALVVSVGYFHQSTPISKWVVEPNGASSLALTRDGRFALLYSQQDHLILWDLLQNKQLTILGQQDPQASKITDIRFSDNGRYAITATQSNFVIWDLAWSQSTGLWSISDGVIRDIDIGNNGEHVLLGLSNGKAIYINMATGRRMEFLAHRDKVNSVALSPNGRYALSGGNDAHAYLWDTQTGLILHQFPHNERINRVALQRDGKYALTSDGGNESFIWDLKTGEKLSELKSILRQLVFLSARFSDDGALLITGAPTGKVSVWETATGDRIDTWRVESKKDARTPASVVYDASFSRHGSIIVGSSTGAVEEWILNYE